MDTLSDRDASLTRAIEQAGGPAALARHISEVTDANITTQAISQWKRCPVNRVLVVESAPGVTEKRHDLRPDIYPRELAA